MLAVAPDPAAIATTLTTDVGGQVLDTATSLAPVVVPFVLALAAIGWVMRKFNLKKKASLTSAV